MIGKRKEPEKLDSFKAPQEHKNTNNVLGSSQCQHLDCKVITLLMVVTCIICQIKGKDAQQCVICKKYVCNQCIEKELKKAVIK